MPEDGLAAASVKKLLLFCRSTRLVVLVACSAAAELSWLLVAAAKRTLLLEFPCLKKEQA